MTTAETEQWAGEAERLHALATSGTVGAEMAAATLRQHSVGYVGALLDARVAAVARCVAVCRDVEVACAPDSTEHVTARAIREAIERGAVGR